jgi:hypothetical protein
MWPVARAEAPFSPSVPFPVPFPPVAEELAPPEVLGRPPDEVAEELAPGLMGPVIAAPDALADDATDEAAAEPDETKLLTSPLADEAREEMALEAPATSVGTTAPDSAGALLAPSAGALPEASAAGAETAASPSAGALTGQHDVTR